MLSSGQAREGLRLSSGCISVVVIGNLGMSSFSVVEGIKLVVWCGLKSDGGQSQGE